MKKRKKRPVAERAARRRTGAMLKPFQAQVFESKRNKARGKTRLKPGEEPGAGW